MGFFGNLVSAPFKGAWDIVKGAGKFIATPLTTAWDGLKTLGSVGKDFVTGNWKGIPGDIGKGVKDIGMDIVGGPLDMLRGSVGLGVLAAGTLGGAALTSGNPLGGIAGYAASAQVANWIE